MESGRVRKRRTRDDAFQTMLATWALVDDEFDAFNTFYQEDLQNGTLTFAMDGVEYAFLSPVRFSISIEENLYLVSAQLEMGLEEET